MIYKIQNKRITNGPLEISYDVLNGISFTGIDVKDSDLAYFAGSLQPNLPASDLLFYSEDFEIDNDNVIFNIDTYTENFLSGVTKIGTRIYVEIGIMNDDKKSILLFDDAIAQPRVYVEGEPPAPTPGTTYATHSWVESNFEPIISNNRKLAYSLLSGTPKINNSTITILQDGQAPQSFTLNQDMDKTINIAAGGGDVTSAWVDENFEYKITNENKLSYNLLSGTPSIPTVNDSQISLTINGVTSSFTLNQSSDKAIEFVVEGGGGSGGVTSSYVNDKISEHDLSVDAHASLFNKKQDVITTSSMLDASYLSGEIPSAMLPVSDVQVKNTSNSWTTCVTDGIAQIPVATSTRSGVIAAHFNLGFSMNGIYLKINKASNQNILDRGTSTATNQPYENCPIVPNNLNFAVSAALTDSKKIQWNTNELSGLQDAIGISNANIMIYQGNTLKGEFTLNQQGAAVIQLDAGGGGGSWDGMLTEVTSDQASLTPVPGNSYFWMLNGGTGTLSAISPDYKDYCIPIDINLSGASVMLSGAEFKDQLVENMMNRCLLVKRKDGVFLFVYSIEPAKAMESRLVGEWTTTGEGSSTYAGAAGIYESTSTDHYENGSGYYIEKAGTNWRLFDSTMREIATGPSVEASVEGEYGTLDPADSVITLAWRSIIV